jgi:hypothetical protein
MTCSSVTNVEFPLLPVFMAGGAVDKPPPAVD